MKQTAQLKRGICYAGLVDVVGGKMWYVATPDGSEYHYRKTDAAKAIRREWKADEAMKRAILAQLNSSRGRAYIL